MFVFVVFLVVVVFFNVVFKYIGEIDFIVQLFLNNIIVYDKCDEGLYLFVLEKVSEKEVLVYVKFKYIIVFFYKIVKQLLVEKRENIINIL